MNKSISIPEWHRLSKEGTAPPVRIQLNGGSMYPLVRMNRDYVTIAPIRETPAAGDIVLFMNGNTGRYVVHRLRKTEDGKVLIRGDNCPAPDGWFQTEEILGKVVLIERGKRIIHTTSAGTQGIVNAVHADEILTGSFVNAKATAAYILEKAPEKVSLVCMGKAGVEPAEEDELCAVYLRSLLAGQEMPEIGRRLQALAHGGGRHFFDPARQDIYPEKDFRMCIDRNRFDFVLKIEKDRDGLVSRMIRP